MKHTLLSLFLCVTMLGCGGAGYRKLTKDALVEVSWAGGGSDVEIEVTADGAKIKTTGAAKTSQVVAQEAGGLLKLLVIFNGISDIIKGLLPGGLDPVVHPPVEEAAVVP